MGVCAFLTACAAFLGSQTPHVAARHVMELRKYFFPLLSSLSSTLNNVLHLQKIKNQKSVLFVKFIIFFSYSFNYIKFYFIFQFYYLVFDFYIERVLLFHDVSSLTFNVLIFNLDSYLFYRILISFQSSP